LVVLGPPEGGKTCPRVRLGRPPRRRSVFIFRPVLQVFRVLLPFSCVVVVHSCIFPPVRALRSVLWFVLEFFFDGLLLRSLLSFSSYFCIGQFESGGRFPLFDSCFHCLSYSFFCRVLSGFLTPFPPGTQIQSPRMYCVHSIREKRKKRKISGFLTLFSIER